MDTTNQTPSNPGTSTAETPSSAKQNCPPGVPCKDCMKGGMPIHKDLLSFIVLVCIGVCTILAVLLVNAKREMNSLSASNATQAEKSSEESSALSTEVPKTTPAPVEYKNTVTLPQPDKTGKLSVDAALWARRSRREYAQKPVTLKQLSQMLWAGQGVTDSDGNKRTAPSAYEAYPFTLFVVVQNVTGLEPGVYEYLPTTHTLGKVSGDASAALIASGVQAGAQKAPVVFLVSASYGKAAIKLKDSAVSSSLLEAGHIGENMYLEAESLGMSTVVMAGFDSEKVVNALQLDPAYTVVYVIPFGARAPEATATPTAKAE